MTLSHGSAQYVMSFYSGIDAFPFGRFRLATVMPGGHVINSSATANGRLPLDWISKWPPRLLRNKTVSYFVYSSATLDDTIEGNGASKSLTQRQFRSFIEAYGGELVHTVYVKNKPRARSIYRATKTEPKPVVQYALVGKTVWVSAKGYAPTRRSSCNTTVKRSARRPPTTRARPPSGRSPCRAVRRAGTTSPCPMTWAMPPRPTDCPEPSSPSSRRTGSSTCTARAIRPSLVS